MSWSVRRPKQRVAADIAEARRWTPECKNLDRVTTNADDKAVLSTETPQPALITLLASGFSPVCPRHVSPRWFY
jgi:hypothetical protein